MEKTLKEYPTSIFPAKLHPRTGKAKRCLMEQIDTNLYDDQANMITFHTSLDRMQYWIKAASIFYYDNVGKLSGINVNWYDSPRGKWTDPDDLQNSIVIELTDGNDILIYGFTIFTTTGTVRAQGKHFEIFVDKHFEIMKELVRMVIDYDESHDNEHFFEASICLGNADDQCTTPKNVDDADHADIELHDNVLENPIVPESKSTVTHVIDQTTQTSAIYSDESKKVVNQSTQTTVYHVDEHFSRLQTGIIETLSKLENSNSVNTSNMLEAVNSCKHAISSLSDNVNKQLNKKAAKPEVVDELQTQLQSERNKHLLAVSQYEESLKHERKMLSETRAQLQKNASAVSQEMDYQAKLIRQKNDEIEALNDQLKGILAAKLPNEKLEEKSNKSAQKDSILLIGTSNVRKINEAGLIQSMPVKKLIAYTIDETLATVENYKEHPRMVILHCLTNDVTTKEPQQCVSEVINVTEVIQRRWPGIPIILSLGTPRTDKMLHFTNVQITNALLKQQFIDRRDDVYLIDHSNMLQAGNPNEELLDDDGYHLLENSGISILAFNIKRSIHTVLGIPMPPSRGQFASGRDKSQDRISQERGRMRGRGGYFPRGRGRGRGYSHY